MPEQTPASPSPVAPATPKLPERILALPTNSSNPTFQFGFKAGLEAASIEAASDPILDVVRALAAERDASVIELAAIRKHAARAMEKVGEARDVNELAAHLTFSTIANEEYEPLSDGRRFRKRVPLTPPPPAPSEPDALGRVASGVRDGHWIPITKRLPEPGIVVDVACADGHVSIASFVEIAGEQLWVPDEIGQDDKWNLSVVTHWLPRPLPPLVPAIVGGQPGQPNTGEAK